MVAASLVGAHPLCNNKGDDTSHLAEIFHTLFKHYTLNSSPTAVDFIQSLRTLAGLGFTACLANHGHIACYQPYLNCFLEHDSGDFRRHSASLLLLSQAMANMVLLAIDNFRFLCHANYHNDFINIVKNILNNLITNTSEKKEVTKRIADLLQKK